MVKASTRQKAGGQLPKGFDKTERVFIPYCYKAPGFQVVHKGKICTKYLSLSKKKPANVWTQSIFNVMYRNFSKTGWGIVSEKGKTFQTACFQNPSEPCEGDGQMFCWSLSEITAGCAWSSGKGQIWSFAAPVRFLLEQMGCSERDQSDRLIIGLCSFSEVRSLLYSNIHGLDRSAQCQQEKEAAHCLIPILPWIKPRRKGKGSFHFLKGSWLPSKWPHSCPSRRVRLVPNLVTKTYSQLFPSYTFRSWKPVWYKLPKMTYSATACQLPVCRAAGLEPGHEPRYHTCCHGEILLFWQSLSLAVYQPLLMGLSLSKDPITRLASSPLHLVSLPNLLFLEVAGPWDMFQL